MSQKRKEDHINLSFTSVPDRMMNLAQMSYEPLLSAHPSDPHDIEQKFLEHTFGMPLWVSSMTGGTEKARIINHNLAKACGEFKLGMGLGSCRPLLDSDERFDDFNVKPLMENAPLYTNLGIAQLEEIIEADQIDKISELIKKLSADGLIIHVNPLQEWMQKEGDRFAKAPIETIQLLCDKLDCSIIVKEVGQGMGPRSLQALLDLPIAAIELAGYGGTNFSILERKRQYGEETGLESPAAAFSFVGHTAEQMVGYLNELVLNTKTDTEVIISGGVKDIVSGHILKEQLNMNAVIGMASTLLRYAMEDYEVLQQYLTEARESFMMARAYIVNQ